jgi:hypothetical protein
MEDSDQHFDNSEPHRVPLEPAFKAEWLRRLRSGEYPQIQGQLRTGKGYCCLGIACDVIDPTAWTHDNDSCFTATSFRHHFMTGNPDKEVRDKVHLSEQDSDRLAGMNDRGSTFAEIADYIEKNL